MTTSNEWLTGFTKQVLVAKGAFVEFVGCRFVGWCILLASGFWWGLAVMFDRPWSPWFALGGMAFGAYLVRQGRPSSP